ncbi:MAG: histidinol dehydrogenase [Chloroflexi bacterium]|nr:histidinol dehydrogenase [Chloroflexota bacterium]
MKIITGLATARPLLSRRVPDLSYPVSPDMKERLQALFGVDDPEPAVRRIIAEVREKGDAALFDLALKIDGIRLASLEVGQPEIAAAYDAVSPELVAAFKLAAERIASFHTAQKDNLWHEMAAPDCGQLIRPLEKVGLYVPGGTAAYPSTVLMTAVPAKAAGVREVVLVTPPSADGKVSPMTLVAADIADVDRVFCTGGAQAIAALAYGTDSIPKVDKICGPGNIFVTIAKRLVFGVVGIDGLQGPSEIMIIADETANPEYCAADILAQAEHDVMASAVVVTTSPAQADNINRQIEAQLAALTRADIIRKALDDNGLMVVVADLEEAIELANLYAPEHLSLMIADAASHIGKVTNAGCVIVGVDATVVLSDYVVGPSHVLPTGGTASFSSPLNVTDFVKFINTINVGAAGLKELGRAASVIARAEGLDAHAAAIEKRLEADRTGR